MAVLVPLAAAEGDVIVLQQNLSGYAGVADTWTGNFDSYSNHGGAPEMRAFQDLDERRYKALVRFDGLAGEIPAPGADQILSAELHLCKSYGQSGNSYANVTAYRLLRPWVEGVGDTGGDQNWTRNSLSGANIHYRVPPQFIDAWSVTDGYTNVREAAVPDGVTVDHFGYGSHYKATAWAPVASIAAVESTSESWYHDTAADMVYFNASRMDVGNTVGFAYYLPEDRWDGKSATGDADVDKASSIVGDWPDDTVGGWGWIYVTGWVRQWFADPATNHGVLVTAGGAEIGWWGSEYNAGTAESPDYTLGPKLVIEYVPAPAALVLLAAGGPLMLRRRRRR
jgi:hypothetical protein